MRLVAYISMVPTLGTRVTENFNIFELDYINTL